MEQLEAQGISDKAIENQLVASLSKKSSEQISEQVYGQEEIKVEEIEEIIIA